MDNTEWNQRKCMCPIPKASIDSITLIDLPDFNNIVRTNIIGNKVMTVNDIQLRQIIPEDHSIRMSRVIFSVVQRAVSHFIQSEILKKKFQELPVFFKLLIKFINNLTTSAVLQIEKGNNTFFRFFNESSNCFGVEKVDYGCSGC